MYTLKVLTSKEFDKLPYKHTEKSYGLADTKKKIAYIRDSGTKYLNIAAIEHEIDELVNKHSLHEDEDGIRHGWFHDLFGFSSQPFMQHPVTQAVLPIAAGLLTGGLGFGGAFPALAGAATGAIGGYQTGKGRGALTGGLGGALGGYAGGSLGQLFKPPVAASIAPSGASLGMGGGVPGGMVPSNVGLGMGGMVPSSAGAIPSAAGGQMGGGLLGGISNLLKDKESLKTILPMLISGAGLATTAAPTMPAFPQVPIPKEYGIASQTYQDLLGGPQGAGIKQEQQAALAQLQGLQMEDYLKQIRPLASQQGWLDSTQYANLIGDYMQKQQAVASMEQSDLNKWLMGQRANVAGGLGTLGGQMGHLSEYNLQGPYQQQMAQYGLDYGSREMLKKQLAEQLYNWTNPTPQYYAQ